MHKHPRIFMSFSILLISTVFIFILLNSTQPQSVGPAGIAGFFLALYVLMVSLLSLAGFALDYIRGKKSRIVSTITIAMSVCLPVVMLLALNTIRSVTVVDFILAFAFGLALVTYVRRR